MGETKRQQDPLDRIWKIEKELREISEMYGVEISIETYARRTPGKTIAASETFLRNYGKKYRHNHYFDGRESLEDGKHRTVRPENIKFEMQFNGCDENCFDCPYPDCLKPETGMKSI